MSLIIIGKSVNTRPVQIHKVRGFTLLEALLGFLILSIGMLGIASLHAISLKSGKSSLYGSVAMMKVDELLESMRANPTPVALAAYAAGGAGAGSNNGCSSGTACDAVQLAQDDIFWWKNNLTAGLPATTTAVIYTPAVAPSLRATLQVDVSWVERNKDIVDLDGVARTYSATADICTNLPLEVAC